MKAYIIAANRSVSHGSLLVPMLSAFAGIESIDFAEDVAAAVDAIQQRYPSTLIFSRRVFEEKEYEFLASLMRAGKSFIMLPKDLHGGDGCVHIGVDFSETEEKEWALQEIGEILRCYQQQIAP